MTPEPSRVLRAHRPGAEPGALHGMKDGRTVYEVQKDGSWKKVPAAVALRCHEAWKAGDWLTGDEFARWMLEAGEQAVAP